MRKRSAAVVVVLILTLAAAGHGDGLGDGAIRWNPSGDGHPGGEGLRDPAAIRVGRWLWLLAWGQDHALRTRVQEAGVAQPRWGPARRWGGHFPSACAATLRPGTEVIDLFYRNSDGRVWTQFLYSTATPERAGLSSAAALPGVEGFVHSTPAVHSRGSATMDLWAVLPDGRMGHLALRESRWGAWAPIPDPAAPRFLGPPCVVQEGADHVRLIAWAEGNAYWTCRFPLDRPLGGVRWLAIGEARGEHARFASAPAACLIRDRVHVFGRHAERSLAHLWLRDSEWSPVRTHAGIRPHGALALRCLGDGSLALFATDQAGGILQYRGTFGEAGDGDWKGAGGD